MPVFISQTESETARIAAEIARAAKPGDIYALRGNLGAGKSVFARAFVQSLMEADIDVPSPTFTLVQTYDAPTAMIWHFDLYRLKDPEEIYEIGWEEAISDGICLIEWPERLGTLAPTSMQHIHIEITGAHSRSIRMDDV
jgi:tRNA threonylcarbamoyladenosine biosynthesis protein TsaE